MNSPVGWHQAGDGLWYQDAASASSTPPPPAVIVQRTNPLALASFILSIAWLGGIGSLGGLIMGALSRKQLKEDHEGRETGLGFAQAAVIVGIVGLVGACVAWPVIASSYRTGNQIVQTLNGQTVNLSQGQKADLSSSEMSFTGAASVTVNSLSTGVQSQIPFVGPSAGDHYDAVSVTVCAGPDGMPSGFSDLGFALRLSGGTDVTPGLIQVRNPSLSQIPALTAGSCGTGEISFEVTHSAQPTVVIFQTFLPTTTFQWQVGG